MKLVLRFQNVALILMLTVTLVSSSAFAQDGAPTNTLNEIAVEVVPMGPPETVEKGEWLKEFALERPPVLAETLPEPVIEWPVVVESYSNEPSIGELFAILKKIAFFALPGFVLSACWVLLFLIMKHAVKRHFTRRSPAEESLTRFSELLGMADTIYSSIQSDLELPHDVQQRFLILAAELELIGNERVSKATRAVVSLLLKSRKMDSSAQKVTDDEEDKEVDYEDLRIQLLHAIKAMKSVKKQAQ